MVLAEAVSLSVASVAEVKLAIVAAPFSDMVLMFLVMANSGNDGKYQMMLALGSVPDRNLLMVVH